MRKMRKQIEHMHVPVAVRRRVHSLCNEEWVCMRYACVAEDTVKNVRLWFEVLRRQQAAAFLSPATAARTSIRAAAFTRRDSIVEIAA